MMANGTYGQSSSESNEFQKLSVPLMTYGAASPTTTGFAERLSLDGGCRNSLDIFSSHNNLTTNLTNIDGDILDLYIVFVHSLLYIESHILMWLT